MDPQQIKSNSGLHTGLPNIQTSCLRALSKHFLISPGAVITLLERYYLYLIIFIALFFLSSAFKTCSDLSLRLC